jgi:hypothetical protein
VLLPTSQMRALRELEPPDVDEGFAAVQQVPFERTPGSGSPGVVVAAPALAEPGWKRVLEQCDRDAPHLVYDWSPEDDRGSLAAAAARVAAVVSGHVESALCPHAAGPPSCWCRPPLPGLALAFAREYGVDLSRSFLVGSAPAHRTLATTLGARFVAIGD